MKTNKEKFQELSRKEKREHIWEYYKLHIISGIVLVMVIGSLLNTWFINPPAKPAVNITLMGKSINHEMTDELKKQLTEVIIGDESGNKEVFIFSYYIMGENSGQLDLDMATNTKFMANISAQELDILIVERKEFEDLVNIGTLLPLDEIMSQDQLDKISDNLVKLNSEEDTEVKSYGINVTDNEKVKSVMGNEEEKIIGVVSNTIRKDESLKVIKWFLEFN